MRDTADKLEDKLFFDIGTNLVPGVVKRREALGAGWNVAKRQSIPLRSLRTATIGGLHAVPCPDFIRVNPTKSDL